MQHAIKQIKRNFIVCLIVVLSGFLLINPAFSEEKKAEQKAEAKPANTAPEIVAVMHLSYTGIENKTAHGSFEMTLSKAIDETGRRSVHPGEIQKFFATEEGRKYMNCLSLKCTTEAGRIFGADYVLTGNISSLQGQIKINLQLISIESNTAIASDRQTLTANSPMELPLTDGVKRAFSQVEKKTGPKQVDEIPDGEKNTEEAKKAKEKRFYKGELTTIGPLEIVPNSDRVAVMLGWRRLAYTHYIHIEPQFDLRFFPDDITKDSKLRLGFGVPLNLELFSGSDSNDDQEIDKFDNAGSFRSEDWDHWRDYFKVIRYIQYGRKEDSLYLNINRMYAASIGHGFVMKRYITNLDYFNTRVSLEFDGYSKYGGGELLLNDITHPNVIGMLAFLKPGSFFSDHWMAESLSFGFHYHTDWDAPYNVVNSRENSDGSYIYDATDIHFIGGDVELKIVKWPLEKPNVDVKAYFDTTHFLHNGTGITVGALGRFNLYTSIRQAFRVRAEFRVFQDNYTPSYFDSFYEIMKYKYFSESRPGNNKKQTVDVPTKYEEFTSRSSSWDHVGGYFEFSYALLDYVALTLAFDGASGTDNGNFLFHIEVPATKYFQITGTYYKANVDSVANIFDGGASNTMLIALARLRPIQVLAIRGGIRKIIQPSVKYFPNVDSVWDVKADVELFWEF